MKRFILIITMLFSLAVSAFARQFSVVYNTLTMNSEQISIDINKHLKEGCKVVSMVAISTSGDRYIGKYYDGGVTTSVIVVFDDGKKE